MVVSARLGANLLLLVGLSCAPAFGMEGRLPTKPPTPFKPDAATGEPSDPSRDSPIADTWIFSGALQQSNEPFSGTLVTGKTEMQFELKLAGGATCTGGSLKGEVGLVRLSEITCSDERTMRALFVPQGGEVLRVFGHVGEERFSTNAHLLGTEAIPDKAQTAAPKAPTEVTPGPARPK